MMLLALIIICVASTAALTATAPRYVFDCTDPILPKYCKLVNIGKKTTIDYQLDLVSQNSVSRNACHPNMPIRTLYCIDCKNETFRNFCLYQTGAGFCIQVVCTSVVPTCRHPLIALHVIDFQKDRRTRTWTEYGCNESYPRSASTATTTGKTTTEADKTTTEADKTTTEADGVRKAIIIFASSLGAATVVIGGAIFGVIWYVRKLANKTSTTGRSIHGFQESGSTLKEVSEIRTDSKASYYPAYPKSSSTAGDGRMATNEMGRASTNEKDGVSTSEKGRASTNKDDGASRSTNEKGGASTNGKGGISTSEKGGASTSEKGAASTNEKGRASANKEDKTSTSEKGAASTSEKGGTSTNEAGVTEPKKEP